MKRRLSDSVVVITGASSGIGRATALAFARRGANVVLTARDAETLSEVAGQHFQSRNAPATAGNLFAPSASASITGGWRRPARALRIGYYAAGTLLAAGTAWLLARNLGRRGTGRS